MSSVTVSPKFQVDIPKDVRDKMRLAPLASWPDIVRAELGVPESLAMPIGVTGGGDRWG